jgi:diacylglycerol kinase (ATP)
MHAKDKWGVIVNPHSGNKKVPKRWNNIYRLLREINIETHFTTAPAHAIELAKNLVENGYRKIIVIGGDGTLSEVVNGVYLSEIEDKNEVSLAIVPFGTGNDWGRFWGINHNYKKAIQYVKNGKTRLIDIGLCSYKIEGIPAEQYFINGAGGGFDATVAHITSRLKTFLGGNKWVYSVSLLISVFFYRAKRMTVAFNGETIRQTIFTFSIGNGCYSGGGIKQNPDAAPYDGLFDAIIVAKPSFLQILKGIALVFKGRLTELPCVTSFRSTEITIACDEKIRMELDGIDIQGDGEYAIQLVPNALQMVIP